MKFPSHAPLPLGMTYNIHPSFWLHHLGRNAFVLHFNVGANTCNHQLQPLSCQRQCCSSKNVCTLVPTLRATNMAVDPYSCYKAVNTADEITDTSTVRGWKSPETDVLKHDKMKQKLPAWIDITRAAANVRKYTSGVSLLMCCEDQTVLCL